MSPGAVFAAGSKPAKTDSALASCLSSPPAQSVWMCLVVRRLDFLRCLSPMDEPENEGDVPKEPTPMQYDTVRFVVSCRQINHEAMKSACRQEGVIRSL